MSRLSRPTGVDDAVGGVGVGDVVGVGLVGRSRRERRRAPTRPSLVPAPRSLRWVRGLLPGDEGTAWWAELVSCLAETADKVEWRRYVRSYRRGVPRLIWTSWTERLRASRQRELL